MKVDISVADPRRGGRAQRLCWFAGTSDALVEAAARLQLRLPAVAGAPPLLLRDADGDLVPLSAALPSGASFALVLPERAEGAESVGSENTSARLRLTRDEAEETERGVGEEGEAPEVEDPRKRPRTSLNNARRVAGEVANAPAIPASAASAAAVARTPAPAPPLKLLRVQSVASVVTQFLNVFTQAIGNDDNVSFIPNTGRFALYALYTALVADQGLHPASQDTFYKMTSMQGKVDRQRANRFYRHRHASGGVEVVQYRPQGKGPLLRKYVPAESSDAERELTLRAGALAPLLDQSPASLVDQYVAFVRGFEPISKAEYRSNK
ncbi:hypothetical protein PybrP1_011475 [[Pythium] brassicae (nom. inval.)]|nr:hypothetical protein PybrP1_011475 [[Pythium] brassicae (nom. inval.)]